MTAPITRSHDPKVREATRGLADARDEQIAQVVAMLDGMPVRGAADQIIAPLRPRLARLRPPRPLRFARLLFLPLDPVIVAPPRWRPNEPTIPRTAIAPVADHVRACLGSEGPRIAELIKGRTTSDTGIVEEAGTLLWPRASEVLAGSEAVTGWDTTGLDVRFQKPLIQRIGALLSQACRLQGIMSDAASGVPPPDPSLVQTMLVEVSALEPGAQPMFIALLLARNPDAGPSLAKAAASLGQRGEAMMRSAGERAAEVLLDQMEMPGGAEGQIGGQDLAEAGAAVRRMYALLGALEGDGATAGRRERVRALRERIRGSAESLFSERLASDLLGPLSAVGRSAGPEAEWDLENAARGLRALETEARRIGGGKSFDTLLGQAADAVREITVRGGLGQSGGLRLMEILAGPEVALALFAPNGGRV